MVNLIDCTIDEFKKNTKNKRIILFGAGMFGEYSISSLGLEERIIAVVDNDKNKHEIYDPVSEARFPVIGLGELPPVIHTYAYEELAILVTTAGAMFDIVEQLDSADDLEGVDCYLLGLLREKVEASDGLHFFSGEPEIPKIIHYFWIGNGEIPDELKGYIDSWMKVCPDYRIIRWDESNYDFTKNRYMREAYEKHMWSFATDYSRLDVVYEYGGIYLDTDIELVESLDKLRNCDAFFGFANAIEVSTGIGFGAKAKHPIIKDMMNEYNTKGFLNEDGTANKRICSFYQNSVLSNWGFDPFSGEYQERRGVVIYPSEVLSPYGVSISSGQNDKTRFSDCTIGIHHNYASWIGAGMKDNRMDQFERIRKRMKHG